MPRLVLYCAQKTDLPSMGALEELSEERVRSVVSEAFERYKATGISVSSVPVPGQSPVWEGKCKVGDTECIWKLMRGLYE